nr:hypothetical protein CFP56_67270 [Quercus suber]
MNHGERLTKARASSKDNYHSTSEERLFLPFSWDSVFIRTIRGIYLAVGPFFRFVPGITFAYISHALLN